MRRVFRYSVFLLGFLYLLLSHTAQAQTVRRENDPYGSLIRTADNAADKQNIAQWPHLLIGETGTQVHVTFDLHNADVNLFTEYDFGVERALQEARQIAPAIGYPNADYILNHGTHTLYADIELNKYLRPQGESATSFSLDLGALARALKASHLPQPIILFVDGSDADTVTLLTPRNSPRHLGEAQFYTLSEIPADATLAFQVHLPNYVYLIAYGFASFLATMLAFGLLSPWWAAWKRLRKGEDPTPTVSPLTEPTEIQRRYNAGKPLWMMRVLPMTPLLLMLLVGNHHLLTQVMMVFPTQHFSPMAFFLLMPLMLLSFGGAAALPALYRRFRGLPAPTSGEELSAPTPEQQAEAQEAATAKPQMLFFIPLMVGMMIMPALLFVPALRQIDPLIRIGVIFGIEALTIVPAVLLMMRTSRRNRRELAAGDPFFEEVQALASRAGVRVKRVIVTTSPTLNASASVFGTVGVTSALLRKMEPDELRAIVAHEIGHLKASHPHKALAIGLTVLTLYLVLIFGVVGHYENQMNPGVVALLRSPLPGLLFGSLFAPLMLGKGQRRREVEADSFAVALTGDAELVIRALRKLHTLSATPHMLKTSDEVLASHPSLAHRIEAILAASPPH